MGPGYSGGAVGRHTEGTSAAAVRMTSPLPQAARRNPAATMAPST
jgi:hypothetical protein